MSNKQAVATAPERQDVAQQDAGRQQAARRDTQVLLPPVDVFEDEKGITLTADLPGVSNDRLNLRVEQDTLFIEGEAVLETPEAMTALYAEIRNPTFRRSFVLSSELDAEAIQANLKDGVLTVHLPRREAFKPRRIQVQAG
ncbi:MAG: Hsp20/alpha crystallin family protein [Pseudomonadota bacterium]|nr:Hsp20/alpha crystallin family protein [Pseudomonadota bacterium]